MFYYTQCDSPVGRLTLASDGKALAGLWLEGQKYFMASLPEQPVREDRLPIFEDARAWLSRYFAGGRPSPDELPLAPMGSAFRQAVWKELCAIPCGEVTTYGAIAARLTSQGMRTSARAVGGAVGHNPISIVIPCHRVVGSNGSLTGYAGGVENKRFLLLLENAARFA